MLVFDLKRHLIFDGCLDEALPAVVAKLWEYARSEVDGTAARTGGQRVDQEGVRGTIAREPGLEEP
jgi:hypothetical protein